MADRARDLAARAWAEVADRLDLQLSPLGLRAMAALNPQPGEAIADIGCGAGQTLLQLAEHVGPSGRVLGVDIAPLLLKTAKARAKGLAQVSLIEADAQALALPDRSLDGVFSRFGVMAFTDPSAAFANFRRMLKPSGRLAFVCWRSLEENALDLLPLRAAGLEAMADPTPFRFEDPRVIHAVLSAAGFSDVVVEAHDQSVSSGDLEAMLEVLLRVGPLGRILRETPALRAGAEPGVRAALAALGDPSRVCLPAATWIVVALA